MDHSARAADAFKVHMESGQRFDYFITGAIAVVLGFALKEFDRSAGETVWFLVPLAWACLLVSLGGGLWHLQEQRAHLRAYYEKYDNLAELDAIDMTAASGQPFRLRSTGDLIAEKFLVHRHGEVTRELKENVQRLSVVRERSTTLATVRNVGLLAGVGILTLWRILNIL